MMRTLKGPDRIRRRPRRGAAVVECACVAPLLVLLTLGAIDAGQFVNVAQIVTDASREGARRAARNPVADVADVEAAVQNYLAAEFSGLPIADLNAATTIRVTDGSGTTVPSGNLANVASGSSLAVEVSFDFDAVHWISASPVFANRTLQTTTVMRRE